MQLSFSNWFKKTTPKVVQIIGDIGLLAAFISTNLLFWKQSLIDAGLTSLANNPVWDKVNAACLLIGLVIKMGSKFFSEPSVGAAVADVNEFETEVQRLKDLKLIPQDWHVTLKK